MTLGCFFTGAERFDSGGARQENELDLDEVINWVKGTKCKLGTYSYLLFASFPLHLPLS